MPLVAGSRLGPYEVLDLLGAGGMVEVYRARHPRLGRTAMRSIAGPLLLALRLASSAIAQPAEAPPPHDTLFYTHDGLRLEAYLYTPPGAGPHPLVVYNHGSALPGEERHERPVPFVARILIPAGYAVLVPERRGYGRSEGKSFSEDIGQDRGPRFVARLGAEAGDVDAAVDHVLHLPGSFIDPTRVAIMGWSFGGAVTTLAAGRDDRYAAAIVQAPGSLNWDRSEALRAGLTEAAAKIRVPIFCLVAENDATVESARAVCAAARANGTRTLVKIYPRFDSGRQRPGTPAGHALFGPSGVRIWEKDTIAFLADATKRPQ